MLEKVDQAIKASFWWSNFLITIADGSTGHIVVTTLSLLLVVKKHSQAFGYAQLLNGRRVKGKNSVWSRSVVDDQNLDSGCSSGNGTYGSDPPLFMYIILYQLINWWTFHLKLHCITPDTAMHQGSTNSQRVP